MLRIILPIVFACAFCCHAAVEVSPITKTSDMPFRLGGVGGVYFYVATPGKLSISIMKAETSATPQPMRAILAAPDREVLADIYFPGTGDRDPRLATVVCDVPAPGVYLLNITAPDDSYGERLNWAFTTDCPKFLIEISRAHRDARHEEPIELFSPDHPGAICFPAYPEAMPVELSRMSPGTVAKLIDADGKTVAELKPDDQGRAEFKIPAQPGRSGLWQLSFNQFNARVHIGELTRWISVPSWEDSAARSLWTLEPGNYFDFAANRRLMTPYRRKLDFASGEKKVVFVLRNYAATPRKVRLSLEYPDGGTPFARLPDTEYTLTGDRAIVIKCAAVPAGTSRQCRLTAECDGFKTYSTITVENSGEVDKMLSMPLTLKPYQDENELFAYDPDHPTVDQFGFAPDNRGFIINRGALKYFRDGAWHDAKRTDTGSTDLRLAVRKIGFDDSGRVYLLGYGKAKDEIAYLWSTDGGANFNATLLPGKYDAVDIEQFAGANTGKYPPPVTAYRKTSGRETGSFWRQTCDMELLLPEFKDGKLRIPEALSITDKSIGVALHSGMASTLASYDEYLHIIWAEATDPADKSISGVPTFVASCDRRTGKLGKPTLIGYGPPANDIHNTPSILVDHSGYVHAFVGTHGLAFQYSRSRTPNAESGEWTPAARVLPHNGMTYIGVISGRDNGLYLVYRQWKSDHKVFPDGFFAELSMIKKTAGNDQWSEPHPLVRPPFTDYSVFYHRFGIDRKGNMFISYDCWPTYWFYRNDHLGSHRVLLMSPDNAKSWRFATESDLK